MFLLNPKEIKVKKQESIEKSSNRVNSLAIEENRLALKVNQARVDSEKEIKEIKDNLELYKKGKKIEMSLIERDIESLRQKRKKLLEPVDKLLKEAESKLLKANEFEIKLVELEKTILEAREKNMEEAENNLDQKDELGLVKEKLDSREKGIVNQEENIRESADTLSNNWVKYHREVNNINKREAEVFKREMSLKTVGQALEARRISQNEREDKLYEKAGELESNYKALEQAKIHLGIK